MTDHTSPLSDEELSAHLDGEAGPGVSERIAADPAAQARTASLAGAARAVATAPVSPLPSATVDDLVARALATAAGPAQVATGALDSKQNRDAGEQAPLTAAGGRDDSDVVPLSPRRSGRGRGVPPAWLVAAVVLLVVAIGAGLIVTGRNGGQRESASQTKSGTAASGGAGEGLPSGTGGASSDGGQDSASRGSPGESPTLGPGQGPPTPSSTTTPTNPSAQPAPLWLGAFPSADALRTALAASFPSQSPPQAEGPPSAASLQRCADQIRVTLALQGQPLHRGYAAVDGAKVLVYEFASTSFRDQRPTTLVAAVGAASCDPVATFER